MFEVASQVGKFGEVPLVVPLITPPANITRPESGPLVNSSALAIRWEFIPPAARGVARYRGAGCRLAGYASCHQHIAGGQYGYSGQLACHVHRAGLAEGRRGRGRVRGEEERLRGRLTEEHYVVAARDQHLAVVQQLRV